MLILQTEQYHIPSGHRIGDTVDDLYPVPTADICQLIVIVVVIDIYIKDMLSVHRNGNAADRGKVIVRECLKILKMETLVYRLAACHI